MNYPIVAAGLVFGHPDLSVMGAMALVGTTAAGRAVGVEPIGCDLEPEPAKPVAIGRGPCTSGHDKTMMAGADFLVELRGFEPLTSQCRHPRA
jgi:hypothetical protein